MEGRIEGRKREILGKREKASKAERRRGKGIREEGGESRDCKRQRSEKQRRKGNNGGKDKKGRRRKGR